MAILGLEKVRIVKSASAIPIWRDWGKRVRQFYSLLVLLLAVGGGFAVCNRASAQTVSREYPLKAAFIFNFLQFTQWPTNTFTTSDDPFVIGIIGSDPFGIVLDATVRDETWNGHKIIIKRYRRLEEVTDCQLLFISESETKQAEKILAHVKGKPILTVCDTDSSTFHDVVVRLGMINNRIRFTINMDSLKNCSLTVSSKLLRVAEIASVEKK